MPQSSNKTQIRGLVGKWARAVRAKDMGGVLANHTDDIVIGRRCANVGQRVGWAAPGHWWLTL